MNELYHSGTKGMHWYERLYQNPDGTWTALGKMRRAAAYHSEKAKKRASEKAEAKRKKYISKHPETKKAIEMMTDAEINEKISRMELEQKYRTKISEVRSSTKTVMADKIKKYGNTAVDKVFDVGVNRLTKYLSNIDFKNVDYYDKINYEKADISTIQDAIKYYNALNNITKTRKKGN